VIIDKPGIYRLTEDRTFVAKEGGNKTLIKSGECISVTIVEADKNRVYTPSANCFIAQEQPVECIESEGYC
jgi:hypothetical protein